MGNSNDPEIESEQWIEDLLDEAMAPHDGLTDPAQRAAIRALLRDELLHSPEFATLRAADRSAVVDKQPNLGATTPSRKRVGP